MTSRQRLEAEEQAEEARYHAFDGIGAGDLERRALRDLASVTHDARPSTRAYLEVDEEDDQEDPTP